jgi:hypothetical protein
MTATVSGRVYTKTRVRGFADWSPRAETIELIDTVAGILHEYRDYLPLTIRQIFYRLVGAHGYDKTEQAYSRLCEHLNRARRARLIPMSAIRDDGTIVQAAPGWDGPDSFWSAVRHTADSYVHNLDAGQPVSVEAWIEAGGMVPQIARIGHEYGIDVYSAGGFDSLTLKHEAAARIAGRKRPTVVLHLGDYDPSGLSILDSVAEDVTAFVDDLDGPTPTFTRLAVIPEQIRRYRLPTAPQKTTDRRGEQMSHTVQAEALSPDQLAAEVRTAIEDVVDLDVLAHVVRRGAADRAAILHTIRSWNDQPPS